jgi:hypothetical protein
MNIYIFRSLINPSGFVAVWSTILKLYAAGLGFRGLNLNLNYFMIILILKPPSNNTSSIKFFPICTWIIAIWLSIVIVVVPTFGTKGPTCFFCGYFYLHWVFFGFSFCQRYFFSSRAILSNYPKFKA